MIPKKPEAWRDTERKREKQEEGGMKVLQTQRLEGRRHGGSRQAGCGGGWPGGGRWEIGTSLRPLPSGPLAWAHTLTTS